MHKKLHLKVLALGFGMITSLMSVVVLAEGLDGNGNVICAAIDVVGCENGPGCVEGSARSFDLPEFMFVDFNNKLVRATKESGHKQISPIKNLEKTESQLILQGVENQRGWSVAIDRQTGRMSVTSAGPDLSFMVFGACTAI